MDKQALKKHHFWILLGLAILLVPFVLFGAVFGVGGAAEEKGKKIDAKLTDLKKQAPKSNDYRDKLGEQKEELQKQKERVWEKAYKAQDGLIRWPRDLNHLNVKADKGELYFGDPIDPSDRDIFRKPDVYLAEYKHLPDVIDPTMFPDGDWQTVLAGQDGRLVPEFKSRPSVEDAWLALEDLCVQREVLRDIHAVNQMLAEFLPVPQPIAAPIPPKGKAPEELKRYAEDRAKYQKDKDTYDAAKKKVDEELATQLKVQKGEFAGRFISPYWQLDIVVGRPAQGRAGELAFRGRLTNTSHRRQNVAEIDFKVWLKNGPNADYVLLPIQAEYLAADQSIDFPAASPGGPTNVILPGTGETPLKIYRVEQKLNAKYVPVKQVVKLELGYPSHRFANTNLVASAFSQKEISEAPPPAASPAGPGAPPVPGGGAATDTSRSQNGVPRNRYLERNEQVRRMAVAIVLIVDQGHVQDVIRALSNSRLRFQNTQIHYERFRGSISLDGQTAAGPVGPAPGAPGGRDFGGAVGRRPNDVIGGPVGRADRGPPRDHRPPGGMSRPPGGPGLPGLSPTEEEENNNLVELTIYGLISLYERYPPRAAAGQPGGAPAAPGTAPAPAGPAAPPPPANAPFPPPASPRGDLPAPAGRNPPGRNPPQ